MSGTFALRGRVRVGCGGGGVVCLCVVVSIVWLCGGCGYTCCSRRWRKLVCCSVFVLCVLGWAVCVLCLSGVW